MQNFMAVTPSLNALPLKKLQKKKKKKLALFFIRPIYYTIWKAHSGNHGCESSCCINFERDLSFRFIFLDSYFLAIDYLALTFAVKPRQILSSNLLWL